MNKKIIYTIITITIAIFLIVLLIFINRPQEEAIEEPPVQVTIEDIPNVYILSNEDGLVRFLDHGSTRQASGSLDVSHEDFTGFADIRVNSNGELLEVISYKTKCDTGRVNAFTDKKINIGDLGWLDLSEDLQIFKTYNDELELASMKDFIVGATILQYFTDESGVCGLIQDSKSQSDDIRVVIKNDTSGEIFYEELYLYSADGLIVDGVKLEGGHSFDVLNHMQKNQLASLAIESESPICITDKNGKKLSQYYEGSFNVVNEDPLRTPSQRHARLVLVNTLPLETYVRYVLPSEMPESFAYEAKKAQAVCARTYAYSQMVGDAYASYGANLDDSTMYQVYNAQGTTAITDKACYETEGIVATCKGQLITCYYYSTSPGFTHGLEAWDEEPVSYLSFHNQTANDYGDMTLAENVMAALKASDDTYDSDSPFYRWNATLDFSRKNIANAADSKLGKLKAFEITKRTTAGYVCGMEITYEKGSKTLSSELEVRRFLGGFLKDITLNNGKKRTDFKLLPCAFFVTEGLYDKYSISSISGQKMTLIGGGFGHGIGLSQYGANKMAQSGKDYKEILHYYYDNIEL